MTSSAPSTTFRTARRFRPSYSLLGRAVRRVVPDRLRAEALFLVLLTALALAWLLAQYLVWAWLQPALTTAAGSGPALTFWAVQAGVLAALVLAGGVGFAPAVVVRVEGGRLRVRQGRRAETVSLRTITAAERIAPLRYHRHERRYRATRAFGADGVQCDLLLLRTTTGGPLVLGLAPDDQEALLQHIEAAQETAAAPARPAA